MDEVRQEFAKEKPTGNISVAMSHVRKVDVEQTVDNLLIAKVNSEFMNKVIKPKLSKPKWIFIVSGNVMVPVIFTSLFSPSLNHSMALVTMNFLAGTMVFCGLYINAFSSWIGRLEVVEDGCLQVSHLNWKAEKTKIVVKLNTCSFDRKTKLVVLGNRYYFLPWKIVSINEVKLNEIMTLINANDTGKAKQIANARCVVYLLLALLTIVVSPVSLYLYYDNVEYTQEEIELYNKEIEQLSQRKVQDDGEDDEDFKPKIFKKLGY